MTIVEFFKNLGDPMELLKMGGLAMLLIIVFSENGLAIGFFLPGDSLVLVAGLLCSTNPELFNVHITWLCILMIFAAIMGSNAGYYFGYKVGPRIFNRKDSVIFNKKYLDMTQSFYTKHGGKTLILGRFLPIIRTFAPILAGVIRVDYKNFLLFNIIGAILWVTPICLAGYFVGPLVEDYIGYIIGGFIISTTIILIRTYRKEKKKLNQEQ